MPPKESVALKAETDVFRQNPVEIRKKMPTGLTYPIYIFLIKILLIKDLSNNTDSNQSHFHTRKADQSEKFDLSQPKCDRLPSEATS